MALLTFINQQLKEIFSPLLVHEKAKYLVRILFLLSVVIFTIVVASIIVDGYHYFKPSRYAVTLQKGTDISQSHLMGHYQSPKPETIALSSLPLQLMGIIMGSHGTSRIILAEKGQAGKIYHEGDELASGIKIMAIKPSEVILKKGDELQELPLRQIKSSQKKLTIASIDEEE